MHTQPSSAHLESLALCFLSSAAKAADPAVTLASGKLLEVSSDVTVKSNAAGFPIIQFAARTSAGRVWRSSDAEPYPTSTWALMQALLHDSANTSQSLLWRMTTSPPCLQVKAWWPKGSKEWAGQWGHVAPWEPEISTPSHHCMAAWNSEDSNCRLRPYNNNHMHYCNTNNNWL